METPTSSTTRPSTSFLPPETETMETIEENATEPADPLQHREQVQEDLDIDRLLDDPEHLPFGEPDPAPLFRHPLFLQARRRHEYEERPLHVRQREQAEQRGTNDQRGTGDEAASYFVGIDDTAAFLDEVAECVFAVTLPTPASEAEWRSIVKDPSKFVAKKLAKGVEVAWQKLNPQQREAMKEAKMIEINEWLASKVCKAALGPVPPERLMRMRWVLVFKATDSPDVVKAKARLVILGFTQT